MESQSSALTVPIETKRTLVVLSPWLSLADTAAVASDTLKVASQSKVFGSKIAGFSRVELHAESEVASVLSGGSLWLGSFAKIRESATSRQTAEMQQGAEIAQQLSWPASPGGSLVQHRVPWLHELPVSRVQHNIQPDQSLKLEPGDHGYMNIGSRTILELAPGKHRFMSLRMEPGSILRLTQAGEATIVVVEESLQLRSSLEGNFEDLAVAYLGAQALALDASFGGAILAPEAKIELEDAHRQGFYQGSLFAKNIELRSALELKHIFFKHWADLVPPVPTASCTTHFTHGKPYHALGYTNYLGESLDIPRGVDNQFSEVVSGGAPTTHFLPGDHPVDVVYPAEPGRFPSWTLKGSVAQFTGNEAACTPDMLAALQNEETASIDDFIGSELPISQVPGKLYSPPQAPLRYLGDLPSGWNRPHNTGALNPPLKVLSTSSVDAAGTAPLPSVLSAAGAEPEAPMPSEPAPPSVERGKVNVQVSLTKWFYTRRVRKNLYVSLCAQSIGAPLTRQTWPQANTQSVITDKDSTQGQQWGDLFLVKHNINIFDGEDITGWVSQTASNLAWKLGDPPIPVSFFICGFSDDSFDFAHLLHPLGFLDIFEDVDPTDDLRTEFLHSLSGYYDPLFGFFTPAEGIQATYQDKINGTPLPNRLTFEPAEYRADAEQSSRWTLRVTSDINRAEVDEFFAGITGDTQLCPEFTVKYADEANSRTERLPGALLQSLVLSNAALGEEEAWTLSEPTALSEKGCLTVPRKLLAHPRLEGGVSVVRIRATLALEASPQGGHPGWRVNQMVAGDQPDNTYEWNTERASVQINEAMLVAEASQLEPNEVYAIPLESAEIPVRSTEESSPLRIAVAAKLASEKSQIFFSEAESGYTQQFKFVTSCGHGGGTSFSRGVSCCSGDSIHLSGSRSITINGSGTTCSSATDSCADGLACYRADNFMPCDGNSAAGCQCLPLDGSHWLSIIGHETGHCVESHAGAKGGSSGKYYVKCSEPGSTANCSFSTSSGDGDDIPFLASDCSCALVPDASSAHCLNSIEEYGSGRSEGFGHYFASLLFQPDPIENECTFTYYKTIPDGLLAKDPGMIQGAGIHPPNQSSCFERQWRNRCFKTDPGYSSFETQALGNQWSTELDWLGFYRGVTGLALAPGESETLSQKELFQIQRAIGSNSSLSWLSTSVPISTGWYTTAVTEFPDKKNEEKRRAIGDYGDRYGILDALRIKE